MHILSSESIRAGGPLTDVVREMSFSLSVFRSHTKLAELMRGETRRLVLLAESDVTPETLQILMDSEDNAPFGVIVTADRAKLRGSVQAELVDKLAGLDNIEWVGADFDFDRLSSSARRCRRRMLRISRQEVENALENHEFVLRYQPKVTRDGGSEWETREAEALLRWQHPENGLMGPLEFLPELEAFGLMDKLGEYVLREAARQLLDWQESDIHLGSCINLSSSLLGDPMLAETYSDIVREAGLECVSFTFEVIEHTLSDPDSPHIQMLQSLRDKGFRICLDDFRIAASSLSTFEQLPFDEIKIHVSALKRAQNDRVAQTVLAAVTGLAHNLGKSVTAEGVEDQETFDFLKTIECDKMQGFLVSEAVIPSIIQRVYSAKGETYEVA